MPRRSIKHHCVLQGAKSTTPYCALQCTVLQGITSYCKELPCTKSTAKYYSALHVRLCTTKYHSIVQSTTQCYSLRFEHCFVLQSITPSHKVIQCRRRKLGSISIQCWRFLDSSAQCRRPFHLQKFVRKVCHKWAGLPPRPRPSGCHCIKHLTHR